MSRKLESRVCHVSTKIKSIANEGRKQFSLSHEQKKFYAFDEKIFSASTNDTNEEEVLHPTRYQSLKKKIFYRIQDSLSSL